MTERTLTERAGIGYDADCGGYGFELVNGVLIDDSAAILAEWVGEHTSCRDVWFAPYDRHHNFEECIKTEDGYLVKRAGGTLLGSDHECWMCQGLGHAKDVEGIEDGAPCDRCDGDGQVESMGGNWASYELVDGPDFEELAVDALDELDDQLGENPALATYPGDQEALAAELKTLTEGVWAIWRMEGATEDVLENGPCVFIVCGEDGVSNISDVCLPDYWQGESHSDFPYRTTVAIPAPPEAE